MLCWIAPLASLAPRGSRVPRSSRSLSGESVTASPTGWQCWRQLMRAAPGRTNRPEAPAKPAIPKCKAI